MIWIGEFRETHGDAALPSLFDALRPTAPAEKTQILHHLKNGFLDACAPGTLNDVISGKKGVIHPLECRNDGIYAWRSDVAYYYEHYNIILPDDFITHVLSLGPTFFLRSRLSKIRPGDSLEFRSDRSQNP